ncbi:MAG: hypothetical protein J0I49_08670 [Pseudonocardia sp.]|uniref:organomercurial lyase n=1 Tax=Pseudonocardia sp. TaxID=60912 RepID=UPI001AC5ADC9|nr:organomercurial lyase [Pseudonocardia sp.]MBN9098168.1 hypothetical protein [Pseudonocardia sp.]
MTTHPVQPVDLRGVAAALGDAFLPMTPVEQQLAREIYRTLLTGHAATVADLAARLHADPQRLAASLERWPGLYRDPQQRITGIWGLALTDMPHRISTATATGAVTTYAWCAFDPLFILPLLGATAEVRSECPVTGEPIRLTVTPARIRDLSPGSTVVSMLMPTGRFDADIRATFCHYVLFLASPQAGRTWTDQHPGTFLLPVADAFDLAQQVNQATFPALTPDDIRP